MCPIVASSRRTYGTDSPLRRRIEQKAYGVGSFMVNTRQKVDHYLLIHVGHQHCTKRKVRLRPRALVLHLVGMMVAFPLLVFVRTGTRAFMRGLLMLSWT